MYLRNLKNYQSMNVVFTTEDGNELWLGDYYAATNYQLLKQKKIASVLTAAAMLGVKYPKQHGINHKTINAFDIPTYKMTPHFQEAFKFIKDGLSKGNILVHCAAGISRSTTCVLVYLMREKNYSLKQGLQMVKAKRSVVNPNYGFHDQLAKYEGTLKKMKKKEENQTQNDKEMTFQEEKNAVLQFVNPKSNLNKTTNSSINNRYFGNKNVYEVLPAGKQTRKNESLKKNEQEASYKRGQSLNNYHQTVSNSLVNNGQKMHHQFLTFKLEQPKIVTIKK